MSSFINIVSTWYASGGIGGLLSNAFYAILYTIGSGLCWIVGILSQFFSVMSGMVKVRYNGTVQTLMDVFFGNTVVEKLYWAMALIGILLCFVFAIIAVARKSVDSGDKMRQSMGGILTGMFKGMLIIISLTFILSAVLSLSDKLLTQINYAFNHADNLGQEDTIEFKDDQYAAMARVLDTIGNYSLNPSYNSRYNLNNCYNEIRADLQYLTQQGVFDFYYVDGDSGPTWQSALQGIVNAADLNEDLDFDVYNTAVSDALLNCMEIMRTDSAFAPLRSYTRQYSSSSSGTSIPLDRIVILMCTLQAAKNSIYNDNASLEDPLRAPYYIGEKSVYNYAEMSSDFDMSSVSYILMIIVACKLIWDLAVIILDCIARIFNMIFLYLVAPPFIGVMPLDEGGKFKQWMTAFVVQCFGVFGTVIAMRVLLIFIPIIANSSLVLFDNAILNQLGKLALILGGMSTAKRASGVITGILADSAGYQAINASNLGDSVRNTMDHLRNRVTGFGNVGEMAKNGLGIRSLFESKEKSQKQASSGGSAPGKAPISGDTDDGWEAPEPPEAPPMPIGDWRGETTEGPEVPSMPVGDWRSVPTQGPDVPPMPHWDSDQKMQVATAPSEVPPVPSGDWRADTQQKEGVPEAPPVPRWSASVGAQVPEAPPMPHWNANAGVQVPEAPPAPVWSAEAGAQVAPPQPVAQQQQQQQQQPQPVSQRPIVPPAPQPSAQQPKPVPQQPIVPPAPQPSSGPQQH